MKSISKVPNKVSGGGSKHKKHETEVVDDTKDLKDVVEKKKIKKMTKLKSVKKIKSIMDIDDDLALKMKKEVEEGKEAVEAEEADDEEEWVEDESSLEDELAVGQAGKGEVGADVQAKIDRILKMFNASSLDDIIEVTPIGNQEPSPALSHVGAIPDDRGGSSFKFIRHLDCQTNSRRGCL